jgi:hypothetical protein
MIKFVKLTVFHATPHDGHAALNQKTLAANEHKRPALAGPHTY